MHLFRGIDRVAEFIKELAALPGSDSHSHGLGLGTESWSRFANAMANGVIEKQELRQQESLLAAMKAVESDLTDDQHAKVTRLLVELSAYIMRLIHELEGRRLEKAFGK